MPDSRKAGWRLLRAAVWEQRRSVLLGALVGLTWTAAKVSIPTLTQRAIDQGIVDESQRALITWALVMIGVGCVQAVSTGARRWYAFGISWRVETVLRQRLFAQLQRLHFAFHDQAQTGQLMSRAATDLQQIQSLTVMIPLTMSNLLTVIAVTGLLLLINVKLALLALAGLPLVNLFAKRFSTRLHPVSMSLQQELAEVATVVEETVSGIRVVKGFGAEGVQGGRLRRRTDNVYGYAMGAAR